VVGHLSLVLNDAFDSSFDSIFDLGVTYIEPVPNRGVNFRSNLPLKSFGSSVHDKLSGLSLASKTNKSSSI
jgi:hypothetical protein